MDRRKLLQTTVWAAPAIVTAQAGAAWANHYPPPEPDDDGNIGVIEVCPPFCPEG